MPSLTDVPSLKSFLGSVTFYGKFLKYLSTVAEPLYRLCKTEVSWSWSRSQQNAFDQLKKMLTEDVLLAYFDQKIPIGVACDASSVGIGAVLFHRFSDGSERPIANASKTLTDCRKRYSQIHREALAIIFGIGKFAQYLYGREFVLVTDHKPLLALFSPTKGTPVLAANRLARWALELGQHKYTIEHRMTADHGNADVLSRLPSGQDTDFYREEDDKDVDTVYAVNLIISQIKEANASSIQTESAKDKVMATVMRFSREGWPMAKTDDNNVDVFRSSAAPLSTSSGCLLNGSRVLIPAVLRPNVL